MKRRLHKPKTKRYTIDMLSNNKVSVGYRLYAEPSALEGFARIMDFSGTLNSYNVSTTADTADIKALCHDWVTVGADIQQAINGFGSEHHYHVIHSGGDIKVQHIINNHHEQEAQEEESVTA